MSKAGFGRTSCDRLRRASLSEIEWVVMYNYFWSGIVYVYESTAQESVMLAGVEIAAAGKRHVAETRPTRRHDNGSSSSKAIGSSEL